MALGNPDLQKMAADPLFGFANRVVLYLTGVNLNSILTWFDADPSQIRQHAAAINTAHAWLAKAQASTSKEVAAVDTYWDGTASREFVAYMGQVNTHFTNLGTAFEQTRVAGNKIADELEKAIAKVVDLIGNLIQRIVGVIGTISVSGVAGPLAPIVALVLFVLNEIRLLIERIGHTNTFLAELDDAVPGSTILTTVAIAASSDTGFDHPSDLTKGGWKAAAN